MNGDPVLFSDSILDALLHPSHLIAASLAEVRGQELWRMADGLRDVTSYTVDTAGAALVLTADCLVGVLASGFVLDRGSNVDAVKVENSADNADWTTVFDGTKPTGPALATAANGCLTPEGAWWARWDVEVATARYWRVTFGAPASGSPQVISGFTLGEAYEIPDGALLSSYTYRTKMRSKTQLSEGGVLARSQVLLYDTLSLKVEIGDEDDYPIFHKHVRRLLKGGSWWLCVQPDSAAGCALLKNYLLPEAEFEYDPVLVDPLTRAIELPLEECIPRRFTPVDD